MPVLMIGALLLGGCADTDKTEERLAQARAEIAAAESVSFLARVSVELEESVFDCVLQVERREDETVVQAVEPEIIAGLSARMGPEDTAIEYDGMILSIGDALSGEISPMGTMPLILDALESGYVSMVWQEQQGQRSLTAAQCFVSDAEYLKIWFDSGTLTPVQAELVSGGRVVVKCSIEQFTTDTGS